MGPIQITNGSIVSNSVIRGVGGGAAFSDPMAGLIQSGNTVIAYNKIISGGNGAGLFFEGALPSNLVQANLNGAQIFSNTTLLSGAGIFGFATAFDFRDVAIFDNQSQSDGGGVALWSSTLIDEASHILRNTGNAGGGLYMNTSTASLSGTQIISNSSASAGGGIYASSTALRLNQIQIMSNTAALDGGGIYLRQITGFTDTASIIAHNQSDNYGGGIYILSGTASLSGTWIGHNHSIGSGGGLYGETPTRTLSLTNAHFLANQTDTNGGGIAFEAGSLRIHNSKFWENSSKIDGGGLYLGPVSASLMQVQIISNSTRLLDDDGSTLLSGNGSGIYVANNGALVMTYSQVMSNRAASTASIYNAGDKSSVYSSTLAHNRDTAVVIADGLGHLIQGSVIFDNDGFGIDLGDDRVTLNDIGDGDSGPNDLQNFPFIMHAVSDANQISIDGRLNSVLSETFTLQFFANASCDLSGYGEGEIYIGQSQVSTDGFGDVYFSEVFSVSQPITTGYFITALTLGPNDNVSEFSECLRVGEANDSWPRATELDLITTRVLTSHISTGVFTQYLDMAGQSRWFKFRVRPQSRVKLTLTELPENYDLALYKDVGSAYTQSLSDTDELSLLNAQFAPSAFAPSAFAPSAFAPSAFAPSAFAPSAFAPSAFAPSAFAPSAFAPSAFAPSAFAPDVFAPSAFAPSAFAPSAFAPSAFAPSAFAPSAFAPSAFASAQQQSLVGISAFNGLAGEGLLADTWQNDGYYYARVKGRNGAFNTEEPFRLEIEIESNLCQTVSDALPATSLTASANNYQTIILTDMDRMSGSDSEKAAMQASLILLASRPEVAGIIVDVGADDRVAAANVQADANYACPYAKNLVAQSVKRIIDRYRALNPLAYIVVVGDDNVIPFFRHPDNALLANEASYIPPLLNFNASQASLQLGYVLGQDAYGSQVDLSLKTNTIPIPDLAVGRLVETPFEVRSVLDAYLTTAAGVVSTPQSIFVSGYDFLEDAALAVQTELEAGTGLTATTLIAARDLSPQDPLAWTADDLRAGFLGQRHDIAYLAGHFSAGNALAADYATQMLAAELISSTIDLNNAIIFSAGCHSGYSVVQAHAVPNLTQEPDWAQAFAQKGATLIGGTGYQYGDTEFIEYGERLYQEFSRQLRTGSGTSFSGSGLNSGKTTIYGRIG